MDNGTHVNKNEYIDAKGELDQMYKQITKGAIIRSRVKWFEEGETNSKYFLGLEKQRAARNSITELKTKAGKNIDTIDDMLNETVIYYSNLYKSKGVNDNAINSYVNLTNLETLSNEDSCVCDGIFTIEECTNAVKELKSNRSPGSDGLTPEFYKVFWNDIKEIVTDSLNEGFEQGELSFSQRRGIINLLYKKGDKNSLDIKLSSNFTTEL